MEKNFHRMKCSEISRRADACEIFRFKRQPAVRRPAAALRPVFSLCATIKGTPLRSRANSLFLHEPNGKYSALAQRRDFACASILMKIIEKAKTALFAFSPNLPNGFWEEGEAARFKQGSQKVSKNFLGKGGAAEHAVPFAKSKRQASEGERRRARRRGKPRGQRPARARGVVFKITKISFVSSKEIL